MAATHTLSYRCPHCKAVMDVETQLVEGTITCPRCDKPFRAEAPAAEPLDDETRVNKLDEDREVVAVPAEEERVVHLLRPAMFRNHPWIYLAVLSVFFVGVAGLVVYLASLAGVEIGTPGSERWETLQGQSLLWLSLALIASSVVYFTVWYIQTWFVTLKVTTDRSVFQRGLIARDVSEVRHDDVRNLQVEQSFWQRLLGVGTIAISSSGQDDFEIRAKGLPHLSEVAETIRTYQ